MTGPRQGNSMQMMRKQKNEGHSREYVPLKDITNICFGISLPKF